MGFVIVLPLLNLFRKNKINTKCEKCNSGYNLRKLEDSTGVNISPKILFSIYIGPKLIVEKWTCPKCGSEKEVKYWSN